MKAKVVLSTTVVQRGKSGVAQYIFGLLGGLASIKASDQIDLTLLGIPSDERLFDPWRGHFQWVPVPEENRSAVRDILWHQTFLKERLRRGAIQVIHVPSYRRILRRPPCRQLVTIHDCAAFAIGGKYDPARMFFGRVIAPWLARGADQVVAVSEATANDVSRYFKIPREAIEVIHNGIDHQRFRPPPAAELEAWKLKRNLGAKKYFVYVARLEHPAKNHVRLIEAFERFKRKTGLPHELLFGGADWHGAERIHDLIRASPFKDSIRALGFVDPAELPFWYAGATAMVYPSLFEGFGFPPLEAMACGCPVISSGRGSLTEITGDACLRIDPENVGEMAAALETAAGNPGTLQSLRTCGFERSRAFSWEATAKRILALYLSLAERL